jgi:hypothetical protein
MIAGFLKVWISTRRSTAIATENVDPLMFAAPACAANGQPQRR